MALFDAFSRKQEKELTARMNQIRAETVEEIERHKQEHSTLMARGESAQRWLKAYENSLADDYNDLVDSFFTRDPAAVEATLDRLGDRAGFVAAIPVYFSDGVTAVTFRDMAEKIFPDSRNLNYRIGQLSPNLPESAYLQVAPDSSQYAYAKPLEEVEIGSGIRTHLSGANVALLKAVIDNATVHLDQIKKDHRDKIPATRGRIQAYNEDTARRMRAVVAYHRALLSGFSEKNSSAIMNVMTAITRDKLAKPVLACGTGDESAADFTALALQSFDDTREVALVCEAMAVGGEKINPRKVLQKAFEAGADLPVESLHAALRMIEKTHSLAFLRDLAIGIDSNGAPWLVTALKASDAILDEFLTVLPDDVMRASALIRAAKAVQDSAAAETLRQKVATLIPATGFLTVSDMAYIRIESIDYAHANGKVLSIGIEGRRREIRGDEQRIAALMDMISWNPAMISIGKSHVINPAHVINAWQSGPNQIGLVGRGGSARYNVDPAIPVITILDAVAAQPGSVSVGAEIFKTSAIDNVFVAGVDGELTTLRVIAGKQTLSVIIDSDDVKKAMTALTAANPDLILAGNEVFNARRTSNVWYSEDNSRLNFAAEAGTLHIVMPPEESAAIIDTLVKNLKHVRVSGTETINPALLCSINRTNEAGDVKRMEFKQGGNGYSVAFNDAAHARTVMYQLHHAHPNLVALPSGRILNPVNIDRIWFDKKLHTLERGKTISSADPVDAAFYRQLAAAGFNLASSANAVNAARGGEMFYQKDSLVVLTADSDVVIRTNKESARRFMDGMIRMAAPPRRVP